MGKQTMMPVSSSMIAAIGYDVSDKEKDIGDVAIKFNNGAMFIYENVPEKLFNELKKSDSIGQFFNKNIKNSYSYVRVQ